MLEKHECGESSDPWTELLQESRQALATLRSDVLEDLAGRAACMLAATASADPIRQRKATPQSNRLVTMAREIDQLRDLLHASARNLKVLRRADGEMRSQSYSADLRHRWVR